MENFAVDNEAGVHGPLPTTDNPVNEVVGVRIPSYVSLTLSYRFGHAVN